jgi:hypothetical protein
MKRSLEVCLLAFVSALSSHAQEISPIITIASVQEKSHTPARHWAWIGSMGFLAAGQFMDYQSSLGKYEANPIIGNSNGRFNSSRGLSLKLAIVGGAVGSQVLMHHFSRNHNSDVMFTSANSVLGSIGAITAIHNYGVPPVK